MKLDTKNYEFYNEGDDLYASMLKAIDGAQTSVLLETYIFADDEVGQRFVEALIAAVRRGVEVCVHIDAAGSLFWHSRRLAHYMQSNGIQLRWFHRWSWHQPWRYNRRNHRKLLVLDYRHVYLGGFNIHRENSAASYGEHRWHDIHISTTGWLGMQAAQLFDAFWQHKLHVNASYTNNGDMLISNHSKTCRRSMRRMYREGFARARQSILITTPYFVPDHRTRQALIMAASRGIAVKLLLPRKTDVSIARWAAHASYARLLAAGVQIYEYLPRVLHAKMVLVDYKWAVVGTANIDYRSFFVNYELNLITANKQLCHDLHQQFTTDLALSEQVHARHWARRPWFGRVAETLAWLIRRWL